ncbi:MAG: hypothetical protein D6820_11820, partial [Lentisphaerae bacterium]
MNYRGSARPPASMTKKMSQDGSWQLPKPYLLDNGLRGKVVLNGFWLWFDPQRNNWKKVRVPNAARNSKPGIYYREIPLPPQWRQRRLAIEISSVKGLVRIDGHLIGKPAGKRFYLYPIPGENHPETLSIEVEAASFPGDIYLYAFPVTPATIDDTYITTSFRKKEFTLDMAGSAPAGSKLSAHISISEHPDAKTVIEFTIPVTAGTRGKWKARVTRPWQNPKLWSRWHPHLYNYTVTLRDARGRKLDAILPHRFGFREVWIENGQFVLNGIPVSVCDDVWKYTIDRTNACRFQAEALMKQLKKYGFNGARLSSEVALEVADEIGMLARTNCGSFVRINIWDTRSGLTAMNGDENIADIVRTIRKLREHPSIIAWTSNTAYSLASMHPQYAGQYYNSWDFFPLNRCSEPARQAQELFRQLVELVHKVDPTRVVGAHNGPYSPLEVCTRYLCNNLDLQEREEFYEYWYRSGPGRKVIWASEFGIPFAGHQYIRYIDHQMPQSGYWPKIHLENAARYFGPSIYQSPTDERLQSWLRLRYPHDMTLPEMQKLTAHNVRRIWRAWRTYGVSSSAHHILNENCYGPLPKAQTDPKLRYGKAEESDPRLPGFSQIIKRTFPMPDIDKPTPAAQAYLDSITPLLGYIGGPDTRFITKDHLFYAQQTVRKAFIVINDYDDPVQVQGKWQLLDAQGTEIVAGSLAGSVEPGRRELTRFT